MQTMNAVELARMAVVTSGHSFVVIDVENHGSSSRWGQAFPSLPTETLNELDEVTVLAFSSWLEAVETFERLTAGCAEQSQGLLVGKITLVCHPFDEDDGTEAHEWDLGDDDRPVFRDLKWTREAIASRI